MNTHTDRIRQMAQEATAYADAMDGSGQMAGRAWSDVRDEYFAQLVAEDCKNIVRQAAKNNPVLGASACNGAAAAIRARYSLKD